MDGSDEMTLIKIKTKFKYLDRVRCVDNTVIIGEIVLSKRKIYIVQEMMGNTWIHLKGIKHWWPVRIFRLVMK